MIKNHQSEPSQADHLSDQLFKYRLRSGRTFLFRALTVSAVLSGLPESAQGASLGRFDEIYVFGDSLSDTGNVFEATEEFLPPSPPYSQGRASNGPLWVEYLAPKVELKPNPNTNFAFSGATTGRSNTIPFPGLPGLQQQINGFTVANPSANPNALYIVWAGADDYLGDDVTNPTQPVGNLSMAVTSLASVGARNIVVPNLPDLGRLPGTLADDRSNALSALTDAHNSGLVGALDSLSQNLGPDTNIIPLDVNALFNRAIATPAEFGFTNVTNACLDNFVVCDNPDEFLFWDDLHPTTAAHQLLGEAAYAAVPEPSSVLGTLAFGTLGAGALLKRKLKKRTPVTLDRSKV